MFAALPERRERAMKKQILIVAALWILVGFEDATKKK